MQASLDWPGNIRQLQAVATDTALASVEKYVKGGRDRRLGIVDVRNETVEKVLSQYFPDVFERSVDETRTGRRNHGRE